MNRRLARRGAAALALVAGLMTSAAFGFWSISSTPGGNGAAAATAVNQGATPAGVANGRSVTLTWAATTMTDGRPVAGYTVKRLDATTLSPQTVGSGCTGTVTATTCTETRVPAGSWVYAVVPRFADNWRGPESPRSSPVTVAAPRLTLGATTVKPGTTVSGQADGFLASDTLRFRLDAATGTELTGTLAGTATPATVPASGGGTITVTVPAGTSDGTHAVYAVTSGGDTASAGVTVDSTPPPAPVPTGTPPTTSGDSVSFTWTEAEATATVECRLDTETFGPCDNPATYSSLAAGSHTWSIRATDTVGNVSTVASYTWTVSTAIPTIAVSYPAPSGSYNDAGYNAGCGTASTGDLCGTADDDVAVLTVTVSIKQVSTGLYWNGLSFASPLEAFQLASGTTDWRYAVGAAALPEGSYVLRARASDGLNSADDTRTFTIDRTAPAVPVLTSSPPAVSGPAVTLAFTEADATARLECRLDGAAYAACASPKAYSGLATGAHTVDVRALDAAGNASAAVTTTWQVDAAAPTASFTFPTATTYNATSWAAGCGGAGGGLCGSAADTGASGLATVAVSLRRVGTNSYWDGSAFAASTETWVPATGTTGWSYAFPVSRYPADGAYVVRVRAVDGAGNPATATVALTIDTVAPPAPQLTRAPASPSGASVQIEFADSEPGTSFQCRLDSGAWTTCTSPAAYPGLVAGQHLVGVRALDAAGNVSDVTNHTWTVDTTLPSVGISSPVSGTSLNDATYAAGCGTPTGDLCGTAEDPGGSVAGVTVSIRQGASGRYWDGSSFGSTTEVFGQATGTTSWTFAMPAAAFDTDGGYTITARATDDVGLTADDTVTVVLDRVAPAAPTLVSGPTGTTGGRDTFTFTGESGAGFQCRVDAGAWAPCMSPTTMGVLTDGSHTFDVRAVDQAGNSSAATSRTWTTDASGPVIGTTFPAQGSRLNNTTYNAGCGTATTGDLCGTVSDAGTGINKVEISVLRDGTGLYYSGSTFGSATRVWLVAGGTTSWTYLLASSAFTADDSYTMTVRATDAVGNVISATRQFAIDRVKPTAVGLATTNAGTARRLNQGDTYSLTYSEAMDPTRIVAGWTGSVVQNVVVRATNKNTGDRLTVYDATNSTLLPLGTLYLKSVDYVTGNNLTFGATGTPSTMTISGGTVTVTLGTPSNANSVGTASGALNMAWTPSQTATDLAGNGCATTQFIESDLDDDF